MVPNETIIFTLADICFGKNVSSFDKNDSSLEKIKYKIIK